jgi:cell division septation protein DedD
MNINRRNQSQFELFPGSSRQNPEIEKTSCLIKDLTLSLENIIVLCIVFIMTLVIFFSFGVEKGKRSVFASNTPDHSDAVAVQDGSVEPQAVKDTQMAQEGERVVFPVDMPQEISEENTPAFQPPVEKTEEQEKLFTIQVASFKREESAKREADRLKGIGHDDAFVLPKGSHSIVCVGKFAQSNDAKKFSNRLKKQYNDCLVRRL